MIPKNIISQFQVPTGKKLRLTDHDPGWVPTKEMKSLGKEEVKKQARLILAKNLTELAEAQELLYADGRFALLVVLQAMDTAGKDGTIKHVMSGVNPQGCQVASFKKPSVEDLEHNFLWRYAKRLPERGTIGIFNRSYYEDVLVVKVHPELLEPQKLPNPKGKALWENRYEDINAFERHLVRNGTVIVKFFLNLSWEEQRRRLRERLDRPEKHWKFSAGDIAERAFWDQYMEAYQSALSATSTEWAPWHIVPADRKWITRVAVADILTSTLRGLDLRFPPPTETQQRALAEAKKQLEKDS